MSKQLAFFATPAEFDALVLPIAHTLRLALLVRCRTSPEKLVVAHHLISGPDTKQSWRQAFLVREAAARPISEESSFRDQDVIIVDPPKLEATRIYLGSIAFKANPNVSFDAIDKEFDRLTSRVRRRLRRPVWVRNVMLPGSETVARGIGYTDGVDALAASHELMQEAVENIRFSIRTPPARRS